MAEITASMVKELREATNAGMMECKKALTEAGGDKEQAVKLLREKGLAIAEKKASRAANEGVVAATIAPDGKTGAMIEVNCETDFVAKNEKFLAFTAELAEKALQSDDNIADAVKDMVTAKIAEIGENIIFCRNCRFVLQGPGAIATYIHFGNKIGVLLEMGCGKQETAETPAFKELIKDITLHIAAAAPAYLDKTGVPDEVQAAEREIYANQVKDKPANIIEKIVDGKMQKFYSQTCLVDQGFIKDPDTSITDLIAAKSKEAGDTISIRRFQRYQVGEKQ